MNINVLEHDLIELSYDYRIDVDEDLEYFIVRQFKLPPGYNTSAIDIMVEIPDDYPESPPGVGESHVYVPEGLLFHGQEPEDYHDWTGPDGWAWWCYSSISWDPCKDNLITFFEIMRAHLTDPL